LPRDFAAFEVPVTPGWRRLKPGWYLLLALLIYALVSSLMLGRSNAALRETRDALAAAESAPESPAPTPPPVTLSEQGLWFPIPGATLPEDDAHLPGAARVYRDGVTEGFDFYDGQAGVPIQYGTPVIAAASGTIERVDSRYTEIGSDAWRSLIEAVADGASEAQLDRLRGRQVWLRSNDGSLLRYAHLADVRRNLSVGQRVVRGQVIGFVGNSGTDDGVAGTTRGARLHFEVWDDNGFFGEGRSAEEIRAGAASLFTGP
jgi:murein DD-endopeptidase MepM/ murein hydrolase activator NlpD